MSSKKTLSRLRCEPNMSSDWLGSTRLVPHHKRGHPLGVLAGAGLTHCRLRKRVKRVNSLSNTHERRGARKWRRLCDFCCGKRSRQHPKEAAKKCLWRKRTAIGHFRLPEFALKHTEGSTCATQLSIILQYVLWITDIMYNVKSGWSVIAPYVIAMPTTTRVPSG